jgi:hypothetical protein
MSDSYLNNPFLTRRLSTHSYTEEQILEFQKCAEDIHYFAENYFTIVHVDRGKIKIPLYDYQKALLKQFEKERFNIVTQSRQSGKTTTTTVFVLHYILFNKDKTVAILANKGDTSQEILSRIQLAFELLPNWLKPNVVEWNKRTVEFENGCRIMARATSSSSIRGQSVACLIIDEAAFVERWDEFYKSTYPTIASGKETKVILVSTVNKLNHFNTIRVKAERKENEFIPFEVKWDDVPGRDKEWRDQTIANTSLEDFMQEHENIALGSTNTLISPSSLKDIIPHEPEKIIHGVKYYNLPISEHKYIITVDTSHGKGIDYSVASVFDITSYPIKQVAIFRDNNIAPLLYTKVINNLGIQYNMAHVLVESNDIGHSVVNELNYEYEYDNLISEKTSNQKYALGIRTTKLTKRIGCSVLKDLIESQKLIIQDEKTIYELANFISHGSSYQAERGATDDIVMTLVMLAWYSTKENFEYLSSINIKDIYSKDLSEIDDVIIPFMTNEVEPNGYYEAGDFWVKQ